MQGVTYESYLTNLYDSINELAKNPTSTVARSSLIQNATAFIEKSENVYKGLRDYQTTLNTQVSNMVNKINDLAGQIYKLNKSIAKVEAPGIEKANDLRDQRDAAIDELSKYIDITYYESENKETIINAAGVPLVTSGELTAMSTKELSREQHLLFPHGHRMKEMFMKMVSWHLMLMIQIRDSLRDLLLQEAIWL